MAEVYTRPGIRTETPVLACLDFQAAVYYSAQPI